MSKILIYETNEQTIISLNSFIDQFTKFEAIIENNLESIKRSYKNNIYEFILIDHSCKNSNELIEFICSANPMQKVILLSNSINCPIDCNSCLSTLRFVRLLKPVDLKSLMEFLSEDREFSCPNKFRFNSINTIEKLYDFIDLSNNIFYRKKDLKDGVLTIYSNEIPAPIISEIEKIKDNVNTKYFQLEVFEKHLEIKGIK